MPPSTLCVSLPLTTSTRRLPAETLCVSLPLLTSTSRLPLETVSCSLPSWIVIVRFFQTSTVWLPSSQLSVADRDCLVVVDLDRLVALVLLVEADLERVVVLDDAIEVLLGVEVDLFGALLVLEAELVEVVGPCLGSCCRDLSQLWVLLAGRV